MPLTKGFWDGGSKVVDETIEAKDSIKMIDSIGNNSLPLLRQHGTLPPFGRVGVGSLLAHHGLDITLLIILQRHDFQ
jgi:hypothetical protein